MNPVSIQMVALSTNYLLSGDETNVRLFLILNPVPRSNNIPSYIAKWHVNNEQYRLEKFAPAGHNLSALGIR